MLVGCRVVYDLWPVGRKNLIHPFRISDRRDQGNQVQPRKPLQQLLLDIVGRVFINVHDHKLFWAVRCDLAAQLAAEPPPPVTITTSPDT